MIGVLVPTSAASDSAAEQTDAKLLRYSQRGALRELQEFQRGEAMKISAELRERGRLN
jgi:hypothetical protein